VARIGGELMINPTVSDLEKADLEMVVACTKDAIVMVEGGAAEATESDVIDALWFAHREAQPVLELLEKLRAAVGKPKREFSVATLDEGIKRKVAELVDADLRQACTILNKKARYDAYGELKKKVAAAISEQVGP